MEALTSGVRSVVELSLRPAISIGVAFGGGGNAIEGKLEGDRGGRVRALRVKAGAKPAGQEGNGEYETESAHVWVLVSNRQLHKRAESIARSPHFFSCGVALPVAQLDAESTVCRSWAVTAEDGAPAPPESGPRIPDGSGIQLPSIAPPG